jgi:hypothetical protein
VAYLPTHDHRDNVYTSLQARYTLTGLFDWLMLCPHALLPFLGFKDLLVYGTDNEFAARTPLFALPSFVHLSCQRITLSEAKVPYPSF